MGGGSSVTFPGYHIFASYMILLTGLSDYVAQVVVVSFFSTFIVAVAFLITRKVWNASAAIIVAFLVAVSRFDLEMLMWGGYPNVITLMLMPLAFYLFLERERLTALPFLIVTSLVSGAIFLTHSLSAVLFIAITLATVFLSVVFAGRMGERRQGFLMWLIPLVLGAIAISPFLIQVAPAYLGSDAAAFTGGVADIRLALLSTKLMPLDIVIPLLAFVFLYFLFSKYYLRRFFIVPSLLLVLWWLVPTLLTQGYLVGLYTDFNRFLYFVILPVIILIGLGLYHSARFFSQAIDFLMGIIKDLPQFRFSNNQARKIMQFVTPKNTLQAFSLVFILFTFLAVPIFATPSQGITVQSFYQLMNNPEYQAIQWAKKDTSPSAIFLTDAQYGWWFSGFAQRPTISAVEPQYLTNAREFEPAKVARYLLDTDYLVDNGLIQIREDGGYIGRHNPEFLTRLESSDYYSYFPYPFLNFDSRQISIVFRVAEDPQPVHKVDLSDVPVADMHAESSNESVSIYVTRQNEFFNFTQVTTVSKGVRFVDVNDTITSNNPTVTFDLVSFIVPTKGIFVPGNGTTIGQIDKFYDVQGQLIFTSDEKPDATNANGPIVLDYNLGAKTEASIGLSVGLYTVNPGNLNKTSTDEEWIKYGQQQLSGFARNYTQPIINPSSIDFFNYRKAIDDQKVSYIAVRDSEQIPRFAKDPAFSLVFINNEVAVFRVNK